MKIFITGASGFVGGAVAERLRAGHEVFAMARSEASAEKVRAKGATPVLCDLAMITSEHLNGMDVVVHAAALVAPWGSRDEFWQANVVGTENMLAAARQAGVRRFVHIGTEAALFDGSDMNDLDESAPYPPRTPFLYSETKKEAEIRVLAAHEPGVFATISLRPRLVWGPGDTTILTNLAELVDSGNFRWIGQGAAKTSTCYIENIAYAVELALEKGRSGEAYFITDGEVTTMRAFLTRLLATVGRDPGKRNVPRGLAIMLARSVEAVWKLFGIRKKPPLPLFSVAITSANCTLKIDKARRDLGYAPLFDIESGMAQLS